MMETPSKLLSFSSPFTGFGTSNILGDSKPSTFDTLFGGSTQTAGPAEPAKSASGNPIPPTNLASPFTGKFAQPAKFGEGIFGGSTTQQKPSGGLFGSTTASGQFGGSTSTGPSFFPTPAPATSGGDPAPPKSSLFDDSKTKEQPKEGGLFAGTTSGYAGLSFAFPKTEDKAEKKDTSIDKPAEAKSFFPFGTLPKKDERESNEFDVAPKKQFLSDSRPPQSDVGGSSMFLNVGKVKAQLFESQSDLGDDKKSESLTFGQEMVESKIFPGKESPVIVGAKEGISSPSQSIHFGRIESSKLPVNENVLTSSIFLPPQKSSSNQTQSENQKPSFRTSKSPEFSATLSFGLSSIPPQSQAPSAKTSGLFGLAFPKVEEKKEERLENTFLNQWPSAHLSDSNFLARPEVKRVESYSIDTTPRNQTKPTVSEPLYSIKESSEPAKELINTSETRPAEQGPSNEETAVLAPEHKSRDDIEPSVFRLPHHFPQMLLTCRWMDVSIDLLSQAFGMCQSDSIRKNEETLAALFKQTRPPVGERAAKGTKRSPNYASLMQLLFESSAALFLSLQADRSKPVSIVGPIVAGVKPEKAIDTVNKVMQAWAMRQCEKGTGLSLLWVDGNHNKVLDAQDDVATERDAEENEAAKGIWESEALDKEGSYVQDIVHVEAVLQREPMRQYSIAWRWGVHEVQASLKATRSEVAAGDILALLERKTINVQKLQEAHIDNIDAKFKEVPQLASVLEGQTIKELYRVNVGVRPLRVADYHASFYGESLTVYPADFDVTTLPPDNHSCLELVTFSPGSVCSFIKVSISMPGVSGPVFSQILSVPLPESADHLSKEATLEDIVQLSAALFLAEADATPELISTILKGDIKARINGAPVESSDYRKCLKDLLENKFKPDAINFVELVIGQQVQIKNPISKAVKLEALPELLPKHLKNEGGSGTVFVTLITEFAKDKDFECLLPAKIGSMIRLSAYESAYARVLARLKRNGEWTEVDYSPAKVSWRSPEASSKPEVAKWTCAVYQKVSNKNTNDAD